MTLSTDVNYEELIMSKDDLSGADIKVNSNNQNNHNKLIFFKK
jgi:ATP-dependent 26S proteasome regulatory subunit